MLYDKREEFAGLVTILVVGAFVVAAVLNRIGVLQRLRRLETKLKKMQGKIDLLQTRESRRLLMELNANPGAEFSPQVCHDSAFALPNYPPTDSGPPPASYTNGQFEPRTGVHRWRKGLQRDLCSRVDRP